eukprot:15437472-Alexandrium_andersonii.AAC.1
MSDGLSKYLRRLAHLLGKGQALASGLSCLADVDLTVFLPGPKSAKSAKHLADSADLARRASRA